MAIDSDRHLIGFPIDLFQPHVILPAQHFPPPAKLAPEQRLMAAVLDDAVRCVQKCRVRTDAQGRRLLREAQQWLLAAEPDWPYSFERICAVFDLDANAVRLRLLLPELDGLTAGTAGGSAGIDSYPPPQRSKRTRTPPRRDMGISHVAMQTK